MSRETELSESPSQTASTGLSSSAKVRQCPAPVSGDPGRATPIKEWLQPLGPCPFPRVCPPAGEDEVKELRRKFLGRDDDAQALLNRVLARTEVVLFGPAGRGKTSLVQAGLIPLLEYAGCRVLPVARVGGPLPGRSLANLANVFVFQVLRSWAGTNADLQTLASRETKLADFLQDWRGGHAPLKPKSPMPLVAVFDQFEEFFLLFPDQERQRRRFFSQLREALEKDVLLRAVFVIREDHLPKLEPFLATLPERGQSRYHLGRLSREAGITALRRALVQHGRPLEENTTDRVCPLLEVVGTRQPTKENLSGSDTDSQALPALGEPVIEPLQLQLVVRALNRSISPTKTAISPDDLEIFARQHQGWGPDQYLEELYEETIQWVLEHPPQGVTEEELRQWVASRFVSLPASCGAEWRGPFPCSAHPENAPPEERFTKEFLHDLAVTAPPFIAEHPFAGTQSAEGSKPEPEAWWYELVHERLGPAILAANAKWEKQCAGQSAGRREPAARKFKELQAHAARWRRQGKKALLSKAELSVAEDWNTSAEAQEFRDAEVSELIHQSRVALERRRTVALGWTVAGLLLVLAIVVALAVTAYVYYRHAEQAQARLKVHRGVEKGLDLLKSGDVPGALLWFNEALKAETEDEPQKQLHLQRLGAALRQLSRPAQFFWHKEIDAAAASRNGRYVLTVSKLLALVRDARTGEEVLSVSAKDEAPINAAEFSPDSRWVVLARGKPGGDRGEAEVWDLEKHQPVKSLKHGGAVTCIAFNHDGTRLVTGCVLAKGAKGEARVWQAATWEEELRLGHDQGGLTHAAFNQDGSRLVTGTKEAGGDRGTVRVWEIESTQAALPLRFGFLGSLLQENPFLATCRLLAARTGRLIMQGSHKGAVSYAAFSPPDGQLVVSVSSDAGDAQVWKVETGQLLRTPEHQGPITYADFGPDGSLLVTTSHDGTAKVWEVIDGGKVSQLPLLDLKHSSSVFHASFTPGGRFLITSGRDQAARVWELTTGKPLVPPLSHNGTVSTARFSADARQVLTTGPDAAEIWEIATTNPILPIVRASDAVNYAALSPDARLLVTTAGKRGGSAGAAQVWEVNTGKLVMPVEPGGPVTYAAFNFDGGQLVTVSALAESGKSAVQIWEVPGRKKLREAPGTWSVKGPVTCAAFSRDGGRIALANDLDDPTGKKGQVWIWSIATDEFVELAPEPNKSAHKEPVTSVAFNRDGSRLVTTSTDDTARIWDVHSRELRATLRHTADVTHAAFSSDGKFVITVAADRKAKLWADKKASSGEIVQPVAVWSHSSYLNDVAYSDGRVATAGQDGTVHVWDVDSKELIALFCHRGNVQHLSFNTKGDQVFALSYDVPTQVLPRDRPAGLDLARGQVHTRMWRLAAYQNSSAEDLELYAEVLSGRRYDEKIDNLVPVEGGDLALRWRKLKSDPREFPSGKPMSDPSNPEEIAWHERRADECEAAREWFAEAWHLTQLMGVKAEKSPLLGRRAQAYAHLPNWRGRAIDDYSEALKVDRQDLLLWRGRADTFYELKQWEKAVNDYSKAIDLRPEYGDLWLRAAAYAELQRWKEAVADSSKALELEPKEPGLWNLRGWLQAASGEREKARNDYAKAIDLGAKEPDVWYLLAVLHLATGHRQQYRDVCQSMLARFASLDDAGTANSVAWTCALSPDSVRDWSLPVRLAEKAVAGAADAEAKYLHLNTLGAVLYRAGEAHAAIKQLEEAMRAREAHAAIKQLEEAKRARATQQESQIEPTNPPEPRPARAALTAVASVPKKTEAGTAWDWLFLAMAHHQLGHAEEARKWLDRAVRWVEEASPASWKDRLELEILGKEAKALLRVKSS